MSEKMRVALVTGSSGGIGSRVAARLGRTCGVVFGMEWATGTQEEVRAEVEAGGARFIPLHVDISNEHEVQNAFEQVRREAGRLDVLVHLAGIATRSADGVVSSIETTTLDEWNRVLGINLTGTFLVNRAAIPLLKESNAGRVINTSSETARNPVKSIGGHYPASKAGVIAFTKVLALELAPYQVTVNCIAPGLTATPMSQGFDLTEYAKRVPLGRIGEPEDVAGLVEYLVSEQAKYITGTVIDVNGGKYMA